MAAITGSIVNGCPAISLRIGGLFKDTAAPEFIAIIDTGFSGFLSMPLIEAFPLGLPLLGTTSVVLADGATQVKLTAMAKATIGSISKFGVVVLEPSSSEILVGMDLLRSLRIGLFVTATGVMLFEETDMEQVIKAVAGGGGPATD